MRILPQVSSTVLVLALVACRAAPPPAEPTDPYVLVLGVAQDGGAPQAGCFRECCRDRWRDPALRHSVAALAIVDPESGQRWMIDATPDFGAQLAMLQSSVPNRPTSDRADPSGPSGPSGILLTHAHVGHYLGLAQLGREAIGARAVPVYAMPRMHRFLEQNEPWSQLVRLGNVELRELTDGVAVRLGERIEVVPFVVPHRDELSETVGYLIRGPRNAIAWLPDIDSWDRWSRPLEDLLADVDVAFLDGTFFDASELPGRDLSEIPHPPIVVTMEKLARAPAATRRKVRFVHLNHTNPALDEGSAARRDVHLAGFAVARAGEAFDL